MPAERQRGSSSMAAVPARSGVREGGGGASRRGVRHGPASFWSCRSSLYLHAEKKVALEYDLWRQQQMEETTEKKKKKDASFKGRLLIGCLGPNYYNCVTTPAGRLTSLALASLALSGALLPLLPLFPLIPRSLSLARAPSRFRSLFSFLASQPQPLPLPVLSFSLFLLLLISLPPLRILCICTLCLFLPLLILSRISHLLSLSFLLLPSGATKLCRFPYASTTIPADARLVLDSHTSPLQSSQSSIRCALAHSHSLSQVEYLALSASGAEPSFSPPPPPPPPPRLSSKRGFDLFLQPPPLTAHTSHSHIMPSYEPPAPLFVTEPSAPPLTRPTSHSFSLHRPNIDAKKTRNAKRLSLVVPPSPGVLENLAAISTPSFPPSSFSRRPFTPARMPTITSSTTSEAPATPTTVGDATTKRHSQFLLDNALPTSRLPVTNTAKARRPISAYFSDFSVECGTASPYASEPVCVLPHLYLGAEHNASDSATLSRLGVNHVLNVAVEIAQQSQTEEVEKNGILYHHLSWTHHQKNLSSEFPEAFDHIELARSTGGKILVHCQLGVSRSASLVIAYVMKAENKSLTEAYDFVKDRSGVISPNMSLMYQLAEFEKSLRGSGSGSGGAPGKRDNRIFDQEEPYHGGFPSEEDMDIDGDRSPRLPQASTSKRNSLVLSLAGSGSSSQEQKPFKPMRPRSTYRHSLLGAEAAASVAASVPKTPLTDRFSFDRSSLAYPPLSALSSGNGSSRLTPVEASPTTPSFVSDFASIGSMPCSAPSSVSSMSSRPSSTSSAATFLTSTDSFYAKNLNQGNGPSLSTIPPSPTVASRRSSKGATDRDSMLLSRRSGSWGPHAPLPEVPPSPWKNTHGSQRKRQSLQTPLEGRVDDIEDKAVSSVGSTTTTSPPGATVTTTGTGTPEFIFSPRPCSPPLLETRNFGDFYQALRMEG